MSGVVENAHIGILGAGLMGHGIALTFARAGHKVTVFDPVESSLNTLHDRIRNSMQLLGHTEAEIGSSLDLVGPADTLASAVTLADIVIEAAPEKLELKRDLFAETEKYAPETAILASNTSVIQISKITSGFASNHRMLGTHWWNPPHQIPLVEVIKTDASDPEIARSMQDLLTSVGKQAVMVEKDVPGFIGNRLQHALWREAISLVEKGVCSAQAVDDVVKSSFGRRLAVLGPLENADLVGIELTQDIHRHVLFDLETTDKPSPYLQSLLEAGKTGMASGAGFRDWKSDDLNKTKARVAEHLIQLETILHS